MIEFLASPMGIWTSLLTFSGLVIFATSCFYSEIADAIRLLFGMITAGIILIGLPVALYIAGLYTPLIGILGAYCIVFLIAFVLLLDALVTALEKWFSGARVREDMFS